MPADCTQALSFSKKSSAVQAEGFKFGDKICSQLFIFTEATVPAEVFQIPPQNANTEPLVAIFSGYNVQTQVKTMTWTEAEDFYSKLDTMPEKRENFLELISHIKNAGLSKRLFPIISLDRLIVSVYENIEFQKEALHISFDLFHQNWNFKYYAKPFMKAEWDKTYPSNLGIEKFDQFIKYIRW